MASRDDDYHRRVFINCPFDTRYRRMFRALVFTVVDCAFIPTCALLICNAATERFQRIAALIQTSALGIHDISRTGLNKNRLPRFNMPFELRLYLGCAEFAPRDFGHKAVLILDAEAYRYQQFLSDLAGRDIRAHGNTVPGMVRHVRAWLANQAHPRGIEVPGHKRILERFATFERDLPRILRTTSRSVADVRKSFPELRD